MTTVLATETAMPRIKPLCQLHPYRRGKRHAGESRGRALRERAGNGERAHREQVLQAEVQTDAKHQQDHTDLRELGCDLGVADNPRRVGANQHTGDEITNDWRKPEPPSD
jgi:hypothetical protein